MPYRKSLRAVGDSLQILGVESFVLDKAGQGYLVRTSEPVNAAKLVKPNLSEKIWETQVSARRHARLFRNDGALHYEPGYVFWLHAQGMRKRRKRFSNQASGTKTLAQLMRTVGRHLDRVEPHEFRVWWGDIQVALDYQLPDGTRVQEVLSLNKLRELNMRSRHRRLRSSIAFPRRG